MNWLLMIFCSLYVLLLPIRSYGYDNSIDIDHSEYWSTLSIYILTAVSSGIIIYFLKRSFVNQDKIKEKDLEHQRWLLQYLHKLAIDYYFPLAKFAYDAQINIKRASKFKETKSIQIAFYHISLFINKYFEFKEKTGANFLFKNQSSEDIAIKKFDAIFIGLPFDEIELKKMIAETFDNGKFNPISLKQNNYKWFESWIKNCTRSCYLIEKKLEDLEHSLNTESEIISHPESLREQIELRSSQKPLFDFYIIGINTKLARLGETIFVFGEGFDNEYIDYEFYIDNVCISNILYKNKNYVKFNIPKKIDEGVYDIYARFKVKRWFINYEYTIGIPLKIKNK